MKPNIEEIIIKKVSVFKTKINPHLFETINYYLKENQKTFQDKSWNCNTITSKNVHNNILYDVSEFFNIKKEIEEKIDLLLQKNLKKSYPFYIYESWINILKEGGYQEFHCHGAAFGAGVLYLTEENTDIEFSIFPEDKRKLLTPTKGDLIIFEGSTFHRVLDSVKERISLAFNFKIYDD
jgi:hypothetical protein